MNRCPACRTRRSTYALMAAHIAASGHKLCNCGGYHYAHRPSSPTCDLHRLAAWNIASVRGESQTVLDDIKLDIGWHNPVISGDKCPF